MKTIKFLFKSLKENTCILFEEQKWYVAVILIIFSMCVSVSSILGLGLSGNANNIVYNSTETCFVEGSSLFVNQIHDTNSKFVIENGVLITDGAFASQELTNGNVETKIEPLATYEYMVTPDDPGSSSEASDAVISDPTPVLTPVLKVWVFTNLDTTRSADSTLLNTFLQNSVYLYNEEDQPTWDPTSFIIFTRNSISISVYQARNTTSSSSPVTTMSGTFDKIDHFDFSTVGYNENNQFDLNKFQEDFNYIINEAYNNVKVPAAWIETGICLAVNVGVTFLCGLFFWLLTRKKPNAIVHYTFWQGQKVIYFETTTASIVSCLISLFQPMLGVVSFLFIVIMRTMSSITRTGTPKQQNNEPVYKARS